MDDLTKTAKDILLSPWADAHIKAGVIGQAPNSFKEIRAKQKFLNDQSPEGVLRYTIAEYAFKLYDPTRSFADLNPTLQEDWLTKVEYIAKALDRECFKMFVTMAERRGR